MRGWFKRKNPRERHIRAADTGTGLSPGLMQQHTPAPGGDGQQGAKSSFYDAEKVYLGVRVKMPVKDLLRNIRRSQGWEPEDLKKIHDKTVKGEKKRVKTCKVRHGNKRKRPTKSLEELEIIVEVLEEDLRASNNYRSSPQSLSSQPPVSPEYHPSGAEYNSDESDEIIPSPSSYWSYSPSNAEYHQALSSPGIMPNDLQLSNIGGQGEDRDWYTNSSAFFWTQLQKEENHLKEISDAELLSTDEQGRTALHAVACVGKRALGYCIAKRMAAMKSLELKDSDGMTALLHAAKNNQHLMVADLIRWGADVNATNNVGKSCLHLSAEKGYIRVLEVLKHTMMDGGYVDVEATDNFGMSVLQCASVALKTTVRELESNISSRLHALHQEQMMETLECLLQMGSYLHTMASRTVQPMIC